MLHIVVCKLKSHHFVEMKPGLFVFALSAVADAADVLGSARISADGSLSFVRDELDTNAAAWGNYSDWTEGHASGFGVLTVRTNPKQGDPDQMRAAGFIEGALTANRVYDHHTNMDYWMKGQFPGNNSSDFPAPFKTFMGAQDTWMRAQIKAAAASTTKDADTTKWEQVGLVLSQFDGLVEGYAASAFGQKHPISQFELQMLNGLGDFFDLMPALMPGTGMASNWPAMQPSELMRTVTESSRCSGLIKVRGEGEGGAVLCASSARVAFASLLAVWLVSCGLVQVTGDLSDIFAGHSTFFIYPQMLRIYKHYDFKLASAGVANNRLSFSSYPGLLSSIDDFYTMPDQNMVMVQTTNSVFDDALYKLVKPQSLLAWHRVRAACQTATGGRQWSDFIDFHNSGTYNNQVDPGRAELLSLRTRVAAESTVHKSKYSRACAAVLLYSVRLCLRTG
jgi:hypothetical protein